jgi:hypothetical protein
MWYNRKLNKDNTSGYKGVYTYNVEIKGEIYTYIKAYIGFNNKHYHLGNFKTKEDAALAYNKFAVKYFGNKAVLNVVHPL